MKVIPLRDAKISEPCVETSKMRGDGTFQRWCIKHHHWLNDAPPQKTVSDLLCETAQSTSHNLESVK